ncbi:MAG: DinB family protein [Chloroflexota bacterium]|nr:DinB family protein [Chloroflexota bacterium]MDE2940852.1 DinB family protein [Chloroflexota bacterium]MDE3267558.1 DinB family protein [Chloroflexota bacterium]
MPDKLALLVYESWKSLDDSLKGLTPEEATSRHFGGSSIAWTVGHVSTMVDSWINVNFQNLPPHPFMSQFLPGSRGKCEDWEGVLGAASEVRSRASSFLDTNPSIDQVIPYGGSIVFLRETGLRLSYALLRIAYHHLIHVGEILTIRSRLGHNVDKLQDAEWGRPLV